MYIYYLLLDLFASLCPHTVAYFDEAKFSIKQFSFIYFSVSVVRQWDEYEIVNETRPIKTKQLSFQDVNLLKKILIYNCAVI